MADKPKGILDQLGSVFGGGAQLDQARRTLGNFGIQIGGANNARANRDISTDVLQQRRNDQQIQGIENGQQVPGPVFSSQSRTVFTSPDGRQSSSDTTREVYGNDQSIYDRSGHQGVPNTGARWRTPGGQQDIVINGDISPDEVNIFASRVSEDELNNLAANLQRATNIQIFSPTGGRSLDAFAAAATKYVRQNGGNTTALEEGNVSAWRELEQQVARGGRGNNGYSNGNGTNTSPYRPDDGPRHDDTVIDRDEALTGFATLPAGKKRALIQSLEALTNTSIPINPNGEPEGIALSQAATLYARQRFNSTAPLEVGNRNAWNQLADFAASDAANINRTPLERSQQAPLPSGNGTDNPLQPRTGAAQAPVRPAPVALPPEDPDLHKKINALFDARIKEKHLSPDQENAYRQQMSDQLGKALRISGYDVPKDASPVGVFSAWMQLKHSDLATAIKSQTPEASKALDQSLFALNQEAQQGQAAFKQQEQAAQQGQGGVAQPARAGITEEDLAKMFAEMKNNPDKYGKKPEKYINNVKRGLGLPDDAPDSTFIPLFTKALNQYADPNTLQAIHTGQGDINFRRLADHVCQDYRDGLKAEAEGRGNAPHATVAPQPAPHAESTQQWFVNGQQVTGAAKAQAAAEAMQKEAHERGLKRAENDKATYAKWDAAHAAVATPAVATTAQTASLAMNPEVAKQAAAANATLNDPHSVPHIMNGTQLHPMTNGQTAAAPAPAAATAPAAALTAEQQQLATQVTDKLNSKVVEFKKSGLLTDAMQQQAFGEAKKYLNMVGIPTDDSNVIPNAIKWGVQKQPDQVKNILGSIDNPTALFTTIPETFKHIVDELKKEAAMRQASGVSSSGIKGGQSSVLVTPPPGAKVSAPGATMAPGQ